MGWQDILKIKINSLSDATRVARDYVPEDYIEAFLLTQEEYDKLSNEEKVKYHQKIYTKYANLNLSDRREAKFHNKNKKRLLTSPENAVHKPHPIEEEDFKNQARGRASPRYSPNPKYLNTLTTTPRSKINQIIIDYFTMYNRRFGRNPTLQDIQNEEGRPLTVDEIESFKRYAQGR